MKAFKIKVNGKDAIIGTFQCVVDYTGGEYKWAKSSVWVGSEKTDVIRTEMTVDEIWQAYQDAQK